MNFSTYSDRRESVFRFDGDEHIKAKQINVFIEDGVPYLRYIGTFYNGNNEYEITFPKMSIDITAIIDNNDIMLNADGFPVSKFRRELYVVENGSYFTVQCKKKKMTKKEIEKELGYEIQIVDEEDD